MQPFKIRVFVPQALAVLAGVSRYGYTDVEPTDEQLGELSLAERERLVQGDSLTLDGPRPEWPTVVSSLRALMMRESDECVARAEKRNKRIAEALSCPDDDWIGHESGRYYHDESLVVYRPTIRKDPRGLFMEADDLTDPRIVKRREWLTREVLPARVAAWEKAMAEYEAREAKRKLEEQEREQKYAETCRAYVRQHVPDFARAAAEGCNVKRPAEQHTEETLRKRLIVVQKERMSTPSDVLPESHGRDEEQGAPHAHAYAVLDAVRAELTREELPAPIASAETSIVRIDTCPERNCHAGKRTAVCIDLQWRDGEATVVYIYADREEPHVHDDNYNDD